MHQGVLFIRTHSHPVFAAHRLIDKLDFDIVADTVDVPIAPALKRKCRRGSTAFIDFAVIAPPRRMGFDLGRFSVGYVDPSAVCLPARYTRCEAFVSVDNAAIML